MNNRNNAVKSDMDNLKLFELQIQTRAKAAQTYFICTMVGIFVGIIFCIAGFVMAIMGLNGSIEWVFESTDFTSRLSNASPGVVVSLMGMLIVWRYKPKITDELEIFDKHIRSRQIH